MRKWMLLTGSAVLMVTLASSGTAGAAPATAVPKHVKPGSVWTLEVSGGYCEVQTFLVDHLFTANVNDDAGTYTGGGKKITETWTSGGFAGTTDSGTYLKSAGYYLVELFLDGSEVNTGALVPGAVSRC
ncbi:MAG TPA: hypothetical protein VEJ87_15220 [Acidimicrobiales bacterium]|nr:hypothetical protein [Acidimicrobiales bacterium]